MTLTPLAQQFVNDGFLVVPDLVSRPELDAIVADAARFARGEYPVVNPPAIPDGVSDDEALKYLLAVHFPHWVSPLIRDLINHPGIAGVLHQIVGAHLAHWDGAVKCCQSMLFVKGPGMQGQAWHQDERFIPTRDRSLLGAWLAIDDAVIDNGCLWVVPGSHRTGYLYPTAPHGNPDEYDSSDMAHGFDEAQAVPVEVRAGSVVFFNGYLLHRSLCNRTSGYRRALVFHYMNAWSLLPWKTKGSVDGLKIPTLDSRSVVPVGPDPYAARGYVEPPPACFLRPLDDQWPDVDVFASTDELQNQA